MSSQEHGDPRPADATAPPAPSGSAGASPEALSAADEYELKLDEQVENFLEVSQRLAFYLIAAAVGSVGFTLTYATGHGALSRLGFGILVAAADVSLATVSLVLLALWSQIESYRMHLSARTQRLRYESLSSAKKARWETHNRRSKLLQMVGFAGLAVGIGLQAVFFVVVLAPQERSAMHHFGEDSTYVIEQDADFLVIFKNKASNRAVTMTIPKEHIREVQGAAVDQAAAEAIAREVAHVLRQQLR
jgi:hypothetical protein